MIRLLCVRRRDAVRAFQYAIEHCDVRKTSSERINIVAVK